MFTLFNLQGTLRCLTGHSAVSSAREASALNSFILTHSIRSVKNFFLFYSKKFEVPGKPFCVFSASSEAARISYYAFPLLSTPFSSFFPLFSPLEKLTKYAIFFVFFSDPATQHLVQGTARSTFCSVAKRDLHFYADPALYELFNYTCQISSAYWRMVRSEENLPAEATFIRHLRPKAWRSR